MCIRVCGVVYGSTAEKPGAHPHLRAAQVLSAHRSLALFRKYFTTIVLACTLSFASTIGSATTPPINCKKAANPVDIAICASAEFFAMDRELAALYDRGLAELSGDERHRLAQGQLAFLKQRVGCAWAAHHSAHPGPAVNECIRDKMENRLRILRVIADRGGITGR